jgi:hypothetical protein
LSDGQEHGASGEGALSSLGYDVASGASKPCALAKRLMRLRLASPPSPSVQRRAGTRVRLPQGGPSVGAAQASLAGCGKPPPLGWGPW